MKNVTVSQTGTSAASEGFTIEYECSPLRHARLTAAKSAFNTRRIPSTAMVSLLTGNISPQVGDLVLARVASIGQHTRIQTPEGRRARLYRGDEVIVCYGHRYAANQFEALVPNDLKRCQLVASGGIAARVMSSHSRMKRATDIEPLGLIGDAQGRAVNVSGWALPFRPAQVDTPSLIIAVAGTEMDSGKTTTVAHIIKGFNRAGYSVGAAKVTGTGACGDYWEMSDSGAAPVYDFVDAGFPSTHQMALEDLERVFSTLIGNLQVARPDVIVLEIADGLLQKETSSLLRTPLFSNMVNSVVVAAGDAMGAKAAIDWLKRHSLLPVAIAGRVTQSPLAAQATAEASGLPVLSLRALSNPKKIHNFIPRIATSLRRIAGDSS